MPIGSSTWCALTGNDHLEGWTNDALAIARLHDLTTAAWFEKKKRPDPLYPKAPPKPAADAPDPRSVEAIKAFMS